MSPSPSRSIAASAADGFRPNQASTASARPSPSVSIFAASVAVVEATRLYARPAESLPVAVTDTVYALAASVAQATAP